MIDDAFNVVHREHGRMFYRSVSPALDVSAKLAFHLGCWFSRVVFNCWRAKIKAYRLVN